MKAHVTLALVLLIWATRPMAGETHQKTQPPHVPEETRAAWEKQGLASGWVRFADGGFLQFHGLEEGKPGDMPTFLMLTPFPGSLLKLPPPARGFAVLVYPGPGKGFKLGAQDLKALGEMERLVLLNLNNTQVPDGSLKELAAAKGLRQLYLVKANLSDAALHDLIALKELRSLSLNDNPEITNAGIKEIGKLKQLRWLSLGQTQITSLKDLAGLEHLENLFLSGTKIADESLADLDGFKKLEGLFLSGSSVTDAGVKNLSRLTQLRVLQLNATSVSDEGLKDLADLKQLKKLALHKTKVTDAGVEKLQKALPDLKIER